MSVKILMVADEPYRFGNGAHVAELADALRSRGHEVAIASGGGAVSDEAEKLGIANYYIPFRGSFSNFRSYYALSGIIRDYKPDVVHAHGLIPTLLCARFRKRKSLTLVSSVYDAADANSMLKLYNKQKLGFLALSEDIYDALYKTGIRGEDITKTVKGIKTNIAPYIPDENSKSKPLALRENAPVILHRAKLDEDGADTARLLLGCIDKLDAVFPGIQLVILGEGTSFNLLSNAANDINKNVGRPCVFMAGNRPDTYDIVSKCDIFIGSSRMVLEALALDKPVVLSDNDGFGGLFTYEKLEECLRSGFSCAGHDKVTEKDLLTAIAVVLKSKRQSRERLGEYGKGVLEKYCSIAITASDCVKAYSNAQPYDRKIVFSGYYGFDNSGDEAILDATIHAIHDAYPHTEITVLSNDPFRTEKQYGCKAVKRFNPFAVLSAIKKCDILVSGGSLFQDTTSTRSLLYYTSVIYIAKQMKKKIMIYGSGIGPVIGDRNRRITAAAVSAATTVTLRDSASLEDLRDMGVTRTDMRVTADPIFLIDPAPDGRVDEVFSAHKIPTDGKFILVSPRPWENAPSLTSKTAKMLDALIEKYGYNVVFLPIQLPYDTNASENITALMKNKAYIIDKIYQAEDIAGIVGRAEAVVGMRLAPLIYASRMGVPFAGIDNDPISKSQLDTFDMYDLGSPEQFDYMNALNLMSAVLDNRAFFAEKIASDRAERLGLARINTTEINRLIESVPRKNKDIE